MNEAPTRRLFARTGVLRALLAVTAWGAACDSKPSSCPTCAVAKLKNQWCDKHNVGYVAGVPIKSKLVHDMLDAHGHDLVPSAIECKSCQTAMLTDGFCEKCRIGWINKRAYFSRLTYHLGQGEPRDTAAITCAICRKNAEKYGWCEKCGIGMLGNVVLRQRAEFEDGCRGYDLMIAAIEASARCENCALAILGDGYCFVCKAVYKNGKLVGHSTTHPVEPLPSGV